MTAHARPCYEGSSFRSVYLELTPTHLPTRLDTAYIHSASARILACPGIRSFPSLPPTRLVSFPSMYNPLWTAVRAFPTPLPLTLDSSPTARRLSPFVPTSLVSQSFSLVVTPALQYPSPLLSSQSAPPPLTAVVIAPLNDE